MINKYIAFDFETIADRENLPEFDEQSVKVGNLKDPEKIKAKIAEAKADYYSKAGLNPHHNMICCFGFCDGNGPDSISLELESPAHEKALISEIWEKLSKYDRFITFNGIAFDVPVLKLHSLFHQVRPALTIDTKKYHIGNHLDIRAILGNWDQFAKGDLNYYADRLLGEKKTEDIDGKAVQDYWDMGLIEDIEKYCRKDAQLTWDLGQLVIEYYL